MATGNTYVTLPYNNLEEIVTELNRIGTVTHTIRIFDDIDNPNTYITFNIVTKKQTALTIDEIQFFLGSDFYPCYGYYERTQITAIKGNVDLYSFKVLTIDGEEVDIENLEVADVVRPELLDIND